jgi:hypothetical protein
MNALHYCDTPPCCNPFHAFLGTQKDNIHDCIKKGRSSPPPRNDNAGESNGQSRLTAEKVIAIRSDERPRRIVALEKARENGVALGTVYDILAYRTWKHLA